MDAPALKTGVRVIVARGTALKDLHVAEKGAPVNPACIFSQDVVE